MPKAQRHVWLSCSRIQFLQLWFWLSGYMRTDPKNNCLLAASWLAWRGYKSLHRGDTDQFLIFFECGAAMRHRITAWENTFYVAACRSALWACILAKNVDPEALVGAEGCFLIGDPTGESSGMKWGVRFQGSRIHSDFTEYNSSRGRLAVLSRAPLYNIIYLRSPPTIFQWLSGSKACHSGLPLPHT